MKKLRPNKERARHATIATWGVIAATGAMLLVEIYTIYLTRRVNGGNYLTVEEIDNYTNLIYISSGLVLAATIAFFIVYIMWFRRAYFNIHTMFPTGRKYKEGWAAGAWFVPIFNWFGPNQIAGDMLSTAEQALLSKGLIEPDSKRNSLRVTWWGFWISGSILGNISSRMTGMDEISNVLAAISSVLIIAAGMTLLKFIKMYSSLEDLLPKVQDGVSVEISGSSDILDEGF